MPYHPPIHEWVTIPDWQEGSLAILAEPGLLRFRLDRRVVFIGYAASAKTGIGRRVAAYRRGDVKTHKAAQLIAKHKHKLELQIAFLDLPPGEIRALAKGLILKEQPELNTRNSYAGRL